MMDFQCSSKCVPCRLPCLASRDILLHLLRRFCRKSAKAVSSASNARVLSVSPLLLRVWLSRRASGSVAGGGSGAGVRVVVLFAGFVGRMCACFLATCRHSFPYPSSLSGSFINCLHCCQLWSKGKCTPLRCRWNLRNLTINSLLAGTSLLTDNQKSRLTFALCIVHMYYILHHYNKGIEKKVLLRKKSYDLLARWIARLLVAISVLPYMIRNILVL